MRDSATIRLLTTYRTGDAPRVSRLDLWAKRLFDICASSVALVLLAPLFIFVAWRLRRDSPGPVFYFGERIGKGGKPFSMVKFRTMREDPHSYAGPRVTAQDDPRVTTFGHWLRETKINELPQFWNVLKGDMSVVGPRPEDPKLIQAWPAKTAQEVLSVRPGITSPASILYRNEERRLTHSKLMDTYLGEILPSKLRLDQLYVRYRTFWGDLDVIFWTMMVILPQVNVKEPPEQKLFMGPLAILMRRHIRWFIYDLLVTLTALALTGLAWRIFGPLHVGWQPALLVASGFAALFSLVNVAFRVNQIEWSRATSADALELIPGIFISTVAVLLANNLLPASWLGIPDMSPSTPGIEIPVIFTPWGTRALLPNSMLLEASALAFAGFLMVRYRTRLATGLASRWISLRGSIHAGAERVLILGSGETGQLAATVMTSRRFAMSFHVVGFADDDLSKQESRIYGFNVLGGREDIPDLVDQHDIGIIVFAIHNISLEERQHILDICNRTPARVFLFPDIPAALQQITRPHPRHNGSKPAVLTTPVAENLTSGVELKSSSHSSPATQPYIEDWLIQLENTAKTGDLPQTLAHIQDLKARVRGEAIQRQAANPIDGD